MKHCVRKLETGLPEYVDGQLPPDSKTIRLLRLAERPAKIIGIHTAANTEHVGGKTLMTYLEMLSNKLPLTCFIRGNNENVMTIYA